MQNPNDDGAPSTRSVRQRELEALRERGMSSTLRNKYNKDSTLPLSTPEEAAAFLASVRASKKQKDQIKPPTNLSSADLDSWYQEKKNRDAEEKRRRDEAEKILHGYRMSASQIQTKGDGVSSGGSSSADKGGPKMDVVNVDARSKMYASNYVPMPEDGTVKKRVQKGDPMEGVQHDFDVEYEESDLDGYEAAGVSARRAMFSGAGGAVAPDAGTGGEGWSAANSGKEEEEPLTNTAEQTTEAEKVADPSDEISQGVGVVTSEEKKEEENNSKTSETSSKDDAVEKSESPEFNEKDEKPPKGDESPLSDIPDVKPETEDGTGSGSEASEKSVRDGLADVNNKGEFVRSASKFRNTISRAEKAQFPPESGRYHLYVSYACGWAHRTLIVLALKGLEDCISVTVVHPIWQRTRPNDASDEHRGWIFGDPDGKPLTNTEGLGGPFPPAFEDNERDPLYGSYSIRDLYDRANDTEGKYTVPVLWDKKSHTIVSNESSEIIRMLNSEFNEFAKNPDVDLYAEAQRKKIDSINEWVYPNLNNGVYRCGFATSQTAYDNAIDQLTEAFDKVDSILQRSRFIAGNTLTEADVRLFTTLVRFDEVYALYFKCNTRLVSATPALLNYCREIYQIPGIARTCSMEHIKAHYYCSHVELNRYSIIPRGSRFIKLLKEPHNRADVPDVSDV